MGHGVRALLLVALVLALVLALVPPVAADDPMLVRVEQPREPIRPLSQVPPLAVNVTVPCHDARNRSVPLPVTVAVADAPPWAELHVTPATLLVGPAACEGARNVTRTTNLIVTLTTDAPAFRPVDVGVEATAPNHTVGRTDVTLVADYFSILDATLEERVIVASPRTDVALTLEVTNLGNANTTVFVRRGGDNPLPGEGLLFAAPNPRVVPSLQQGADVNAVEIPFTVRTPYRFGYLNERGVLNLEVWSRYTLDPDVEGMTTQVSVLVTTKGAHVAGVGPAGALVASMLAAAAVAAVRGSRGPRS